MLQFTTVANPRPSLGLLVHHSDARREYVYDANPSSSGRLVEALRQAPRRGWHVVDMARDWTTLFAFSAPPMPPRNTTVTSAVDFPSPMRNFAACMAPGVCGFQ